MINQKSLQQTRKPFNGSRLKSLATAVLSSSILLGSGLNANSKNYNSSISDYTNPRISQVSSSQENPNQISLENSLLNAKIDFTPVYVNSFNQKTSNKRAVDSELGGLIDHVFDINAGPDGEEIYWSRPTTLYRLNNGVFEGIDVWGYGIKLQVPKDSALEVPLKQFPFYVADLVETENNPLYIKTNDGYFRTSSVGVIEPTGETPDFLITGIENLGKKPTLVESDPTLPNMNPYYLNPYYLEDITKLTFSSTDLNGRDNFDINLAYFTNKPSKKGYANFKKIPLEPYGDNDFYWCGIRSAFRPMLVEPKQSAPDAFQFGIYAMQQGFIYDIYGARSLEGPWGLLGYYYNDSGAYGVTMRFTELDFNEFPSLFFKVLMEED